MGKKENIKSAKRPSHSKMSLTARGEVDMFAENIINTVREPMLVLNEELKVIKANLSFYNFFRVNPEDTIGRLIFELGNQQWDIPKLRELLEVILPEKITFDNYEVEHSFSTIGQRIILLNARQIKRAAGEEKIILLAIEDITEREHALETIKSNEQKFVTLAEQSPNLIFINYNGRVVYVNQKCVDVMGYSKEEYYAEDFDFMVLIDDDYKDIIRQNLYKSMQGLHVEPFDYRIVTKNNTKLDALITTELVDYLGGKAIMGTITDITERKHTEAVLRESERRTRALLDAVPDLIFRMDSEGTYLDYKADKATLYDQSGETIIGKKNRDITPPGFADLTERYIRKTLDSGAIQELEYQLDTPMHGMRDYEARMVPSGKDEVIAFVRDITKRKEAEALLKESEKFLRETQKIALLGTYALDIKTGKWRSSEILDSIFGIDADYDRSIKGWTAIVHPEWQQVMQEYLTNEVLGSLKKFDKEYKIIRKNDNTERWVRGMGELVLNGENQPIQLVGTIQDITESKLAEESLLKLKKAIDNSAEIIFLTDEHGIFTFANPTFTAIYGYTIDEIIGKVTPRILKSGLKDANDYIQYWEKLKSGNEVRDEFINKRKDGTLIQVEVSTSPVFDDRENIIGFIGIQRDITERKQSEEALLKSQQIIEGIINTIPVRVFWKDKNLTYLGCNNIFAQDAGFNDPKEIIGKDDYQMVWRDQAELYHRDDRLVIESGKARLNIEEPQTTPDGKNITLLTSKIPLRGPKGEINGVLGTYIDITERKQIELTLLERENFLDTLLNAIPIPVFYKDKNGRYLGFNKAYETFFDCSRDELIGKTVFEQSPGELAEIYFAKDNELLKTREEQHYESKIKTKNNLIRDVIFNKAVFTNSEGNVDGIIGTILDITDRKRTEESQRLFRTLLDKSNDAIEVIDVETGQFIDVNERACIDLGYSRSELLGMNIFDIDPNQTPEMFQSLMDGFQLSNSTIIETLHLRKDGTTFPVEVNVTMVQLEKIYTIAIVRDITQRKLDEQELISAKNKAEESDRLKSAFLANMSHEIRTPMNGILGFTELLKEPMLSSEEQQQYIDIIEDSSKRMLNIINDIVNISKIESGQVEISISDTNVNELLDYVYRFFKPEAEQKELNIFYRALLPNDEVVIKTDREKVFVVLTNLVNNAIKFSSTGSVELGCQRKGNFFEFFVKDSGPGIHPEQTEVIFERFRQGSESLTRTYEGAGLGLSISKAYVEMLGGKIWVENNTDTQGTTCDGSEKWPEENNGGATFYFSIPINHAPKEKNNVQIDLPNNVAKYQAKKLKILIAEDDVVSEKLMSFVVRNFAKEILKVNTGIQVVETIQSNPDIDLILMDIKMPGIDGYEATRQIRAFNKEVVIIAQTAYGFAGDREEAIQAGCNDYISKPIDNDALSKMIKSYF
ncbi:hypothetical protein PbJCM13498_34680 [Prolixibacter bellariivorans]|uniref:histidine kinase n=1 Tax=Prolixibacter bellariivorans TaxID=314319 RepID=A0A5M4B378_9BACT|nr:PAS domain S-box protein [Prolixibacter bellariivorans]GET34605.1 hypothetical protein PbJCM13498_34680 [Prolixibacter bellariivorans]